MLGWGCSEGHVGAEETGAGRQEGDVGGDGRRAVSPHQALKSAHDLSVPGAGPGWAGPEAGCLPRPSLLAWTVASAAVNQAMGVSGQLSADPKSGRSQPGGEAGNKRGASCTHPSITPCLFPAREEG